MYLQEIVEVAIGLIFAWLLLSIAILQVQEVIASALKKRAKDLEATIGNMLKDERYLTEFYAHPLIQGLIEPMNLNRKRKLDEIREKEKKIADKREKENKPPDSGKKEDADKKLKLSLTERYQKWAYTREETKTKLRRPSYIPSANFSAALFDIVVKAGTEASPIKSILGELNGQIERLGTGDKEIAKAALDKICQLGQLTANSPVGSDFQKGLKQELKNQVKLLGDKYPALSASTGQINQEIDNFHLNLKPLFSSDQLLEQVQGGIASLFKDDTDSKLGKSLRSLVAGVNEYATNTDKALAIGRKNVETWFDNTMDRMGGWYKRWAQAWAFVIALVIAIVFNIDSIHIARELWRNPATRQASTAYIQSYVEERTKGGKTLEDEDVEKIQGEIQKLNFPVGWNLKKYTDTGTVKLFAGPDEIPGICTYIVDLKPYEYGVQHLFCYEMEDPPQSGGAILVKFFGFLITAGAAMQGAPFWFDTLKKLVNVRSSGINPAEKPKEGTSDKER